MADILEVIKSRRSTRAFKPEQISRNQLEQILEAGARAGIFVLCIMLKK